MLCRSCKQSKPLGRAARRRASRRNTEGLCTSCGHLLGPDAMVKRVRDKYSQLARFGLVGTHGALLEPKPRR